MAAAAASHRHSEKISKRQSQMDRLYVSLKDLVDERKSRLEQQYWLYQLNREVDELEQWIAQQEVVASSTELGQDYEHVTAAAIAEWKDGVNEAWADLLELMETQAQMLAASHQLHKFFSDCREVGGAWWVVVVSEGGRC
ncbi:hypothetical protein CRUP_009687 [Coryphaenoides rupestris]|nr:hypothetical protein CRUP_009687 [Coryphaenoides rupestris]